jgi:hypothetical protein
MFFAVSENSALARSSLREDRRSVFRGLTFELTPTAEAGSVSLVRDDAPRAADQAYAACRSGSGVERRVRPLLAAVHL